MKYVTELNFCLMALKPNQSNSNKQNLLFYGKLMLQTHQHFKTVKWKCAHYQGSSATLYVGGLVRSMVTCLKWTLNMCYFAIPV